MTDTNKKDFTVHEYLKDSAGVLSNENYWIKSRGISKLDMNWEFDQSNSKEFDEGFEFISIWTVIKQRHGGSERDNEEVTILIRSTDLIKQDTKFSDVSFHEVVSLKSYYGLKRTN